MPNMRRIAAVDGGQPEREKARRGATVAPADAPNLDDPQVQEKILRPATMEVTVGGRPIALHPLPALVARAFTGLFFQIISDGAGAAGRAASMRIAGVVIENQTYLRKLCEYTARATFATANVPDIATLTAETDRFYNELTALEISVVLDVMAVLNDVGKAITPKN